MVFLDYWNFQLAWNHSAPTLPTGRVATCDFLRLSKEAVALTEGALGHRPGEEPLRLLQTRVYASHDPANPKDRANREWMHHLLGQRSDFVVRNTPRASRLEPARCRACAHRQHDCPECGAAYKRAAEKTVDAAIIVDLLSLAWDQAYDVALLISNDYDFLPVVTALRQHHITVANGRWDNQGTSLADACDASIRLDALVPTLARRIR